MFITLNKRRALKPWHGILFFLIVMLIFFFVCVPIQGWFGLYGLAITELILLIMALLFAKLMRYPFRILFPIRKPHGLHFLGIFFIWLSVYVLDMVAMLIQYRLFPEQMYAVNSGLNEVIYSVPFAISMVIVAVLPAICEEAVHRGVILHTLYTLKREWVVVWIMGIYFGLFHADPFRFFPTAILGAAISYIMLETENILYAAFFHFINNLLPTLYSEFIKWLYPEEMLHQPEMLNVPLVTIGVYMIFAMIAPFGIYLGNYLLHHKTGFRRPFVNKEKMVSTILKIAIPTALLVIGGFLLMVVGFLFDPVTADILKEAMEITGF